MIASDVGISILIPVKGNKPVYRTIQSVQRHRLTKYEIIILRNGIMSSEFVSYDKPKRYGTNQCYTVFLSTQGKAFALNEGIRLSKYKIICVLDADCILNNHAIHLLLKCFQDERVIAASGRIKVENYKDNILCLIQYLDYEIIFRIARNIINHLRGDILISGAFGLFRKDVLENVNGYCESTVGEDMEIVLKIREQLKKEVFKIDYRDNAICYTKVPNNIIKLFRQRDRWQRGLLDCIIRYRKMMFNAKYGFLGMILFPGVFILEVLGPFKIVIITYAFVRNYKLRLKIILVLILLDSLLFETLLFLSKSIRIKNNSLEFVLQYVLLFIISVLNYLLFVLLYLPRLYGTLSFKWRKMIWK